MVICQKEDLQATNQLATKISKQLSGVMDKTLTPSPWTTQMDYPKMDYPSTILFQMSGTLGQKKKLRLYIYTAQTKLFFWFRIAFSRDFE